MSRILRPMAPSDWDGVIALQQLAFPPPFPAELLWSKQHLVRHLELFPEGQWVVVGQGDQVIASASSLVISEENWSAHRSWEETCGDYGFKNHDSEGTTLFGADISVAPESRGQGIGKLLYQQRFTLVREMKLKRFGTACRMPDFLQSGIREIRDYARQVERQELMDRTLTPLLRMGLTLFGVVEGHMEDEESGNAAAILEWRNPDFC